MSTERSRDNLLLSRRATLQVALATLMARHFIGCSQSSFAQEPTAGMWNWDGNPGHTGELPGPGLDPEGALGELWRMPANEFWNLSYSAWGYDPDQFAGYANGVIYLWSNDGIWARKLVNGEFLWSRSPAQTTEPSTSVATPEVGPAIPIASPEAVSDKVGYINRIALDSGLILVSLTNGHMWALDALTGDIRWDFDSGFDSIGVPTVVNHIAYCGGANILALEFTEQPVIRWRKEIEGSVLGVGDSHVFIGVDAQNGGEIRALTIEDGSEFWRASSGSLGPYNRSYGISSSRAILESYDYQNSRNYLVVLNQDGEVAWNVDNDDSFRLFNAADTITRMQDTYDSYRLESLFLENGATNWVLDVNYSRWDAMSDQPVLCAGKAYALLRDDFQDKYVLVVIDPIAGEVNGVWDSTAIPLFIVDGVMLARDYDTDDIVAIGPVTPSLQVGGRATVTSEVVLRGAPSDSAIERAQIAVGSLVIVTGESENSDGRDWMPVTVHDTGDTGWLPIDVLQGQDGSISFTNISPFEFGQYKAFSKFSAGTRAEITEKVDLRGAPNESSAKKATLEVGTRVTVTSRTTESADGLWCPIKVDDTGESGWVPESVLKLAPRN